MRSQDRIPGKSYVERDCHSSEHVDACKYQKEEELCPHSFLGALYFKHYYVRVLKCSIFECMSQIDKYVNI